MGTVYSGPYADLIDAYSHEGYADRKMPDGQFTSGEWSDRYPADAHVAFVAACTCGWHADIEHPPTDTGEEAAYDQWRADHLNPMVRAEAARHTIRATDLLPYLNSLRQAEIVEGGPLSDRAQGRLDTVEAVEEFLDLLAAQSARNPR
ncbi:MAG TPA: hypothetical protein VM677_03040 [Actinokineospora sp.]|nr:hypothetical protein [Actinokineospora sp.]